MGIYNAVRRSNNRIRFHMPGHNGRDLRIGAEYDITELRYSDNLLSSNSSILDTENKIAKFYGAKYALMFTGGATSAIAAVMAMLRQKYVQAKIFLRGDTHKSTYAQADIHGLNLTNSIESADVLYNTSPDYRGRYSDGFDFGNKQARMTILDASHAAHYPLIGKLIDNAFYDVIIYSLHKTLPVYTGAAAIVTDSMELYEQLLLARQRTHTTSPSYMIMASVDKFLETIEGTRLRHICRIYEKIHLTVEYYKKKCRFLMSYSDDYTRLSIDLGCVGAEVTEALENNGIYAEALIDGKLILILTPFNYRKLGKLVKVLNNTLLANNDPVINEKPPVFDTVVNANAGGAIELIEIEETLGKTLYQEIGIYPPGVPVLLKNTVINQAAIEFITANKEKCFGLINGKAAVYVEKQISTDGNGNNRAR